MRLYSARQYNVIDSYKSNEKAGVVLLVVLLLLLLSLVMVASAPVDC